MDESVVEAGVDVRNTENEFTLRDLGTKRDSGFLTGGFSFLGGLNDTLSQLLVFNQPVRTSSVS